MHQPDTRPLTCVPQTTTFVFSTALNFLLTSNVTEIK